jgi:hypothetical protein
MLSSNPGLPLDNKLLSSLLREQIDQLTPHMTTKQLPQRTVLLETGEEFHSTVASGTRFYAAINSHRRCSRIDGRLVSRFAVQFDKVNQHQPVRRLTAIFDLGKHGTLVARCHPRSQFGLPIPQRNAI